MREIKFRGMDANGIMRYGRLSQDKEDSTTYYKKYSQRICWDDSNIPVSNISLGQFTGFKDKNGKEIYEGDVVKVTNENDEVVERDSDTGIGAVEFLEADGFWYISKIENAVSDLRCGHYFEIIGNIYENPELIQ